MTAWPKFTLHLCLWSSSTWFPEIWKGSFGWCMGNMSIKCQFISQNLYLRWKTTACYLLHTGHSRVHCVSLCSVTVAAVSLSFRTAGDHREGTTIRESSSPDFTSALHFLTRLGYKRLLEEEAYFWPPEDLLILWHRSKWQLKPTLAVPNVASPLWMWLFFMLPRVGESSEGLW